MVKSSSMQSSKDFQHSQKKRESFDSSELIIFTPLTKSHRDTQALEDVSNPFIRNEGRRFVYQNPPFDRKIARIRPKFSIGANDETEETMPVPSNTKEFNFFLENYESLRETAEPDSSLKIKEKKVEFDTPRTPRQVPRRPSPDRRARLVAFIPDRKARFAKNLETSKKTRRVQIDSPDSVQKISFAAQERRKSFQLFEPESTKLKFATRDLENREIALNYDNDCDTDSDQLTKSYNYYIKDFSQTFQRRQRRSPLFGVRRGSLEPAPLRPSHEARLSRTRETTKRTWLQAPPR